MMKYDNGLWQRRLTEYDIFMTNTTRRRDKYCHFTFHISPRLSRAALCHGQTKCYVAGAADMLRNRYKCTFYIRHHNERWCYFDYVVKIVIDIYKQASNIKQSYSELRIVHCELMSINFHFYVHHSTCKVTLQWCTFGVQMFLCECHNPNTSAGQRSCQLCAPAAPRPRCYLGMWQWYSSRRDVNKISQKFAPSRALSLYKELTSASAIAIHNDILAFRHGKST